MRVRVYGVRIRGNGELASWKRRSLQSSRPRAVLVGGIDGREVGVAAAKEGPPDAEKPNGELGYDLTTRALPGGDGDGYGEVLECVGELRRAVNDLSMAKNERGGSRMKILWALQTTPILDESAKRTLRLP
jgi:hypothetical protein